MLPFQPSIVGTMGAGGRSEAEIPPAPRDNGRPTMDTDLPQDYYEDLPDPHQIHGTKRFEEPLSQRQAELLAQALRLGHTCRYCDLPVPIGTTVCAEHIGQYQQYRKKAKRQARRLCELARQRRMVTQPPTRSAEPVTT